MPSNRDWLDTMRAADLRPVVAEVQARGLLDALVWDGAPATLTRTSERSGCRW